MCEQGFGREVGNWDGFVKFRGKIEERKEMRKCVGGLDVVVNE